MLLKLLHIRFINYAFSPEKINLYNTLRGGFLQLLQ